MRILHAIHDFLPRHRAGSEIYAFELARELSREADVVIVAAEYDPATPHGTLRWRDFEGLTVVELVNNWEFARFEETYSSDRINAQLQHVLDAIGPDVLHVHNLLNLSFDLPRIAHARGIRTVATLHDYTLVCPSGGQRVHIAESHICESIDAERCARCFPQSACASQMQAGRVTGAFGGRLFGRVGRIIYRHAPAVAKSAIRTLDTSPVGASDIRRRLARSRHVLDAIDCLVAPSASLASEFVRLGASPDRIEISDYGFRRLRPHRRRAEAALRIGFVGTLVWHKGVHVLIEAARALRGAFEIRVHGDPSVFPDYVGALRQRAAGCPISFAGPFDRDRVEEVYDGIDVLVVPSLWPENSPLVIHEAFMQEVPVVGARIGGIPDLIVHGHSGLLYQPFSAEELAAALQQLIDDRDLVRSLGSRAPHVKTIEEDARQWHDRYRRVSARDQHLVQPLS